MGDEDGGVALDTSTFRKLRSRYVLALSVIALSIILSQILIQSHLEHQVSDSRIVNVAGRQRMLSQKLVKGMLLYGQAGADAGIELKEQIRYDLNLWEQSHRGLQDGNDTMGLPGNSSDLVKNMFTQLDQPFQQISDIARQLLDSGASDDSLLWMADLHKPTLLRNEELFLDQMDRIVFQYDEEAATRVATLRRTELFLLLLSLVVILLELLFIFRPIAISIKNTMHQLIDEEAKARKMASEIERLYKEKEQSLQELRAINFAVDQAALFASATTEGEVIYVSKKFRRLLGIDDQHISGDLSELISTNEGEQQYVKELMKVARSNIWNDEIHITTRSHQKVWLEISVVPVNRSGVQEDLLILCSDITSRKEAQIEIERLNKERFHQEVQEQKERSAQIVEAQEEERKRIARDIHDGIGQMLTSLKFNLEAIDSKDTDKVREKVDRLRVLTTDLIKGVRMATFNLTPPELTDYGISSSLAKLASQLKKLTGKDITFINQTNFDGRFNSLIETNLYRIAQEAVNNAVKYAQSAHIQVRLSHTSDLLSITIEDDGKGFDMEKVGTQQKDSGMGLAFMKDRISFANGRLFIRSAPGQGTRITINMPMEQAMMQPHQK